MRKKLFLLLLKIASCCLAIALCLISIFAIQFGIDNDPGWGKGRYILLLGGILFAFFFLLLQFPVIMQNIQRSFSKFNLTIQKSKIIRLLHTNSENFHQKMDSYPFSQSRTWQRFIFGLIGIVLVIVTFQSVIRSQYVNIQPSNYYNQLADGFLSGQTSLPEKPPQALSDLENPYNWLNREGIEYLWDATFYKGEYYLYWGMVPALIGAAIKLFHPVIILDQHLVWGFYIGISILMALLFSSMHKHLFPKQPAWLILPFTWISGAAMPMLWLTTRPSVYETAIASGQFFLMLGIYAIFQALWTDKKPSGWLILAGFAMGAAVNSRFSLVITVFWFAGFVAIYWYKNRKYFPISWFQAMLCFFVPLAIWAAALLGYNYLRFGDIFEMGHRYQLNGPGMPSEYDQVMSLQYILPSMYSYLIRPLQFELGTFPYVSAPFISESMWPFFIHLPKYYYYPEPTAGILLSTPFVWMSFLPLIEYWWRFTRWLEEKTQPQTEPTQKRFAHFEWMITGSLLLTFGFLLVFNAASMRYLADITPMLMLLSAAGSWWTLQKNEKRPIFRFLFISILIALCVVGGLLSVYANFSTH
jgi:hypothetical protein